MKKRFFLPSLFLLIAIITGCSGALREKVLEEIRANPGTGSFIDGVPFFPQDELMCGPSALASVMGYYGVRKEMDEVAREVYEERLRGTLPIDLLLYAKEKGFDASYYGGSLIDLKEKISEKRPLILFLNLGLSEYPVGHYIVVVGYDERSGAVLAHSGMEREKVFVYKRLLSSWEKTGFSTLLVTPKDYEPRVP